MCINSRASADIAQTSAFSRLGTEPSRAKFHRAHVVRARLSYVSIFETFPIAIGVFQAKLLIDLETLLG